MLERGCDCGPDVEEEIVALEVENARLRAEIERLEVKRDALLLVAGGLEAMAAERGLEVDEATGRAQPPDRTRRKSLRRGRT